MSEELKTPEKPEILHKCMNCGKTSDKNGILYEQDSEIVQEYKKARKISSGYCPTKICIRKQVEHLYPDSTDSDIDEILEEIMQDLDNI